MDTIFTITAAFFGGVSGFISALLYHVTTTYIYPEFRVSVFQSFLFFGTVVLSFFSIKRSASASDSGCPFFMFKGYHF